MITLHQDVDGFIRMNRHFPESASITINFTTGASEMFTGTALNVIFDAAVAEFRARNRLDAKGFSRAPAVTVQRVKGIQFVAVHAGMAA
ncbi:hypothetical protein [Cryobacterium psychrophilum]|uniref:Uncharacterized protein n=1 Tax=Cryobacterium psychrophilum TaxID=41988 RepID=A0A4Y8KPG9_9MICO|nr:hypothetical protein [Cryobacterium psychrophilum]TDW28522.1 hypothetical protein EDD25_0147 [Cryobacterium psychrophilum]TFD80477.1 hypothetical protein E3T53_05210 [Cryobacterium psychrophilum]